MAFVTEVLYCILYFVFCILYFAFVAKIRKGNNGLVSTCLLLAGHVLLPTVFFSNLVAVTFWQAGLLGVYLLRLLVVAITPAANAPSPPSDWPVSMSPLRISCVAPSAFSTSSSVCLSTKGSTVGSGNWRSAGVGSVEAAVAGVGQSIPDFAAAIVVSCSAGLSVLGAGAATL